MSAVQKAKSLPSSSQNSSPGEIRLSTKYPVQSNEPTDRDP